MKLNVKKVLAGISGIGLIILLLLFVNSAVGNPVSNALAKKAAEQYIDTNYPDLQMQIQTCHYNFKFGAYLAFAQSDVSRDTAFSIYLNGFGNILQDDYAHEVSNNFTTFRRLDGELRNIAAAAIADKLDYDFDYASFQFVKEADIMELERDMDLDIHRPPLPLTADVTIFSGDLSHTKIAEVAKAMEKVLAEQNIPVAEYSIRLLPLENKPPQGGGAVSWAGCVEVSSFPAERLGEENLAHAMERFEIERKAEMNAKGKK